MAKVKLGNVKGSKGDKGDRGSLWRVTDKMTGQSTSDTAFPGANIEDSAVGDMCLNPITCDIYKCTAGGDAANAKWVWVMNNRGPQGPAGPKGDPTTVDAVLSKDSVNPIQNKAVATKFQDVQDSLDQLPYIMLNGGIKELRFLTYDSGFQIEAVGNKTHFIHTIDRSGIGLKNETTGEWYWQNVK